MFKKNGSNFSSIWFTTAYLVIEKIALKLFNGILTDSNKLGESEIFQGLGWGWYFWLQTFSYLRHLVSKLNLLHNFNLRKILDKLVATPMTPEDFNINMHHLSTEKSESGKRESFFFNLINCSSCLTAIHSIWMPITRNRNPHTTPTLHQTHLILFFFLPVWHGKYMRETPCWFQSF